MWAVYKPSVNSVNMAAKIVSKLATEQHGLLAYSMRVTLGQPGPAQAECPGSSPRL